MAACTYIDWVKLLVLLPENINIYVVLSLNSAVMFVFKQESPHHCNHNYLLIICALFLSVVGPGGPEPPIRPYACSRQDNTPLFNLLLVLMKRVLHFATELFVSAAKQYFPRHWRPAFKD